MGSQSLKKFEKMGRTIKSLEPIGMLHESLNNSWCSHYDINNFTKTQLSPSAATDASRSA